MFHVEDMDIQTMLDGPIWDILIHLRNEDEVVLATIVDQRNRLDSSIWDEDNVLIPSTK